MNAQTKVTAYLDRTGQTQQELFSGAAGFGVSAILKLIDEANELGKKIVWYYANESDLDADRISYKFE